VHINRARVVFAPFLPAVFPMRLDPLSLRLFISVVEEGKITTAA
jgi:hypothetical protein